MSLRTLLFILCLVIPASLLAGDWHVPGSLVCTDCHVQHGVDSDDPGFIGPYSFLLRKNSVNELCLSCHDGTDATAPDVLDPVAMYNTSPTKESAAGFFTLMGMDNPNGHTLAMPIQTPLQAVPKTLELNCISCHAAHGNANYRNLLQDPAETGANISVIEGTHVFSKDSPTNPPTPGGTSIAYSRDNIAYAKGLATWCTSCHDQLSDNGTAGLPAHFASHPSDVPLNEFFSSSHTDATHWLAGTGEGFLTGGGVDGSPRIPFQAQTASDWNTAQTVGATNEVSCVSCHKAHGSTNKKAMLWPYLEGGDAYLSGCQQCHNK